MKDGETNGGLFAPSFPRSPRGPSNSPRIAFSSNSRVWGGIKAPSLVIFVAKEGSPSEEITTYWEHLQNPE